MVKIEKNWKNNEPACWCKSNEWFQQKKNCSYTTQIGPDQLRRVAGLSTPNSISKISLPWAAFSVPLTSIFRIFSKTLHQQLADIPKNLPSKKNSQKYASAAQCSPQKAHITPTISGVESSYSVYSINFHPFFHADQHCIC